MAIPVEIPMSTYFIYREKQNPYDTTAAAVFFPPAGSDDLFYALRAKFPNLKTHSERMRDAMIEFLFEEQQNEPLQPSPTVASDAANTSPWQTSWPSMSAESSTTLSSPETLELPTPSFHGSPYPSSVAPQPGRHRLSTATSAETSPPALEKMTGVFSLSSTEQPRQRLRRKMTEAEKIEYRKRRIVKACDKCAKRKRKCHHNQPEMETIASDRFVTSDAATKINTTSKKTAVVSAPNPPMHPLVPSADSMDFTSPSFSTHVDGFDDFASLIHDDPLPDLTFDDLLRSDSDLQLHTKGVNENPTPLWPWSETEDWMLMDSRPARETLQTIDFFDDNFIRHQGGWYDEKMRDMPREPDDFANRHQDPGAGGSGGGNGGGRGETVQRSLPDSTRHPAPNSGSIAGDEILWERMLAQDTEMSQVILTTPVHNSRRDGAFTYYSPGRGARGHLSAQEDPASVPIVIDSNDNAATPGPLAPPGPISQRTNRVAANVTGDSLHSAGTVRSRTRRVSLRARANDGPKLMLCTSEGRETNAAMAEKADKCKLCESSVFQCGQDLKRHGLKRHQRSFTRQRSMSGRPVRIELTAPPIALQAPGTLVSAIRDKKASHEGCSIRPPSTPMPPGPALSTAASRTKLLFCSPSTFASPFCCEQNASPLCSQQNVAARRTLGESITRTTSPSTELFRLKRRIPRAVHNMAAPYTARKQTANGDDGVPTPLLQSNPLRNPICTECRATRVSGGACHRLDSSAHNQPILTDVCIPSQRQQSAVVPTLACNPAADNLRGDTDVQQCISGTDTQPRPIRALADLDRQDKSVLAEVHQERLSDHMRRRDHFGRSALLDQTPRQPADADASRGLNWVLVLLAALVWVCGRVLFVPYSARGSRVESSWLVLALCCRPVVCSAKESFHERFFGTRSDDDGHLAAQRVARDFTGVHGVSL